MRHGPALFVALCIAFTVAASVRPVPVSPTIDSNVSAGLFVGVRTFRDDASLTEVRYAVDDAIGLAYAFAIEPKSRLIDPSHVVLALSGEPQREESKTRLAALKANGARTIAADQVEILKELESQAANVGANGILIVTFATHGITEDGQQYLLAANSLLQHHRQTSLSEDVVRDVASRPETRSLLLIDACRTRLTSDTRDGVSDPRSVAALLRDRNGVTGQAVLSAAAAGRYAYDDDVRRQGVFTAAVLDGLQCSAAVDRDGYVTLDTLSDYVEANVLTWIRKHRDRNARVATQLHSEGLMKKLAVSRCGSGE